jgi:hypothetical protein
MKKVVMPGDIIAVKLDDNTYAYGQYIYGAGIGCYIFFEETSNELLSVDKLDMSCIFLLSYCVEQRIQNGKWEVIGNQMVESSIYVPEFKTDIFKSGKFSTSVVDFQGNELRIANDKEKLELDYAWSVTPNVIESALLSRIYKSEWCSEYNIMLYKTN